MNTQSFKRLMPIFAFFLMLVASRAENKVLWEFEDPNCTMFCCKFSPDEKYIIHTIGTESSVVVRDIESGKELRRSKSLGFYANNMYFSEDGTKIILSAKLAITILDIKTLDVISTFTINEEILKLYPPHVSDPNIRLTSYYDNDKSIIAAISVPVSGLTEDVIFVKIDPSNTKNQNIVYTYSGQGQPFLQSPNRTMIAFSNYSSGKVNLQIFDLAKSIPYWTSEIGGGYPNGSGWEPPTISWSNDSKNVFTKGGDFTGILNVEKKEKYFEIPTNYWHNINISPSYGIVVNNCQNIIMGRESLPSIRIPSLSIAYLFNQDESPSWSSGSKLFSNSSEKIIVTQTYCKIRLYQIDDLIGTSLVNEPGKETLLYPNPTNQNLVINIKNDDVKNIDIFSTDFKKLIENVQFDSDTSNKIDINVSHLPNGIYFIKIIKKDNIILNFKFVKE